MRADQLPNMPGKICTMRHSADLQPRSTARFGARYSPLALALMVSFPQLSWGQAAEGRYSPLTQTQTSPWAAGAQPLYPLAKPAASAPGQAPSVFKAAVDGVDYSVNANASHLVVEVASNGVPADGQTGVPVTVRVLGADGKPFSGTVFATIEHTGGRILLPGAATDEFGPRGRDADRTTPGVQLEVRQGVARFTLLAPATAQDVQLRVTVGAQEASGVVSFVPDMREMVAVGLVEGVINLSGRGNLIEPVRSNDRFEREIRHFSNVFNGGKSSVAARAAVFLKGVVKGEYLLTAAYDSDKETRSRLLSDIKPDEFYPVYGDASLKFEEAKSSSALFVRVDKDRSYLMYGDFSTGDGFSQRAGNGAVASVQQRSLGAYNRSATGVRWHYEGERAMGNVFAFRDTLRQVIEEFASQGSGPYGLRNNNALQDSEKVEVLVRDRDQPSRILSVKPLVRLADYSFEPFSGRIILNQFLSAFDASLNPVTLRVTYEADQGGDAFWVVGADGQLRISDSVEIGGSLVQDKNPLAANRLASANISWRISPQTVVVAELAQTSGEVNTNAVNQSSLPGLAGRTGDVSGKAWRVEMAHQGENTEARVFLGQSDPTFNNLASPLTGGRSEAFARGAVKLTDSTKVYAQVQRSEDRNPGTADRNAAQVGVTQQLTERLVLDVGLRSLRESAGTTTATLASPFASASGLTSSIGVGAGGGAMGFGNQSIDPVSGLPVIQSSSALPGTPGATIANGLRSDTLRVGLGFKATDLLTLGGEIEHEINGDPRRRFAVGADYQIAERTSLYGRVERQTGLSSPNAVTTESSNSNALVFGVNTSYWRDTQVFSEYRLRDALSGRDNQLASGIRNGWDFAPGLRLNTAYEFTQVVSGAAPTTRAVSLGLDYSAHPLWKGSTKLEHRISGDVNGTPENEAFNTTLWQVMAARKIDRDWTFLARNYLLKTDYALRGGVFQDRVQLGFAYRDTDTNRLNALAKYEYKNERDASSLTTGPLRSKAHIVSVHADWHPSRPWWMTGRVAAKRQADQFEGGVNDRFNAKLLSGRVIYDVTENWDLGFMTSAQFGQNGARQYAVGLEAGYLLKENLWLSVGYNKTGFTADRDLSGYEYTQQGVYLRLRFKFDQNLFADGNKTINRSLER
jgi:hypothetical protein